MEWKVCFAGDAGEALHHIEGAVQKKALWMEGWNGDVAPRWARFHSWGIASPAYSDDV
jgi:hypothetical protein